MHAHRPAADPALTPVLPPGLRFPYAIGRPGPNEPTGPRSRLDRDAQDPPPARHGPRRSGATGTGTPPRTGRGTPPRTAPRTPPGGAAGAAPGAGSAPPRALSGARPGPVPGGAARTRAVDAVAAAFLAGEPRPGAVPRGPRRAWFDVPDPHRP